jgi:hypothetical protein
MGIKKRIINVQRARFELHDWESKRLEPASPDVTESGRVLYKRLRGKRARKMWRLRNTVSGKSLDIQWTRVFSNYTEDTYQAQESFPVR